MMSKKENIIIDKPLLVKHIKEDTIINDWQFPAFPFQCDLYLENNVKLEWKQILNLENINGKINIYSNNNNLY